MHVSNYCLPQAMADVLQGRMGAQRRRASSAMPLLVCIMYVLFRNSDNITLHTEKDTFGSDKVQVVGISPDSVAKQKSFVEKNKLTVSPHSSSYCHSTS